MPFVVINGDGELEFHWPFWVRERFDIVVGLWFEVVELLGVLPLAPWIEIARERIILECGQKAGRRHASLRNKLRTAATRFRYVANSSPAPRRQQQEVSKNSKLAYDESCSFSYSRTVADFCREKRKPTLPKPSVAVVHHALPSLAIE
ncbi:hypothetical protein EKO04_008428 [Ascochyta lentis]|uniref:Uncharacterized protein n=1 Tax=Ascochyta lentis TaxID=205686 RepID=A0A8H7MG81_9PLEO|nr:hypothetical protein EKO04_008428 [Ascochyta lentis]